MTIAEQLTELNDNLSTINNEIITQEDMIAQIKAKLEGGVIEITPTPKAFYGTATTNEFGEVEIPYPNFVPQQMMLWNVTKVDRWEEYGYDEENVRYVYEGIMICATRLNEGNWISQYVTASSGGIYLAQNSAEVAPYPPDFSDHPTTNVVDDGEIILWSVGVYGDNWEGSYTDFTEVTFNYVLVG